MMHLCLAGYQFVYDQATTHCAGGGSPGGGGANPGAEGHMVV